MTRAEFFQRRAQADYLKRHGVTPCAPGAAIQPMRLSVRMRRSFRQSPTVAKQLTARMASGGA